MRFLVFAIFLCLCTSLELLAQEPNSESYIVLNDSSIIKGQVVAPDNFYKIFQAVEFVGPDGKVKKFKPDDLKGFKWNFHEYESIDGEKFMRRVFVGDKIALYEYSTGGTPSSPAGYIPNGQGGSSYMYASDGTQGKADYYLKRPDQEMLRVEKTGFKKKYSQYFKDCKKVSELISNKTLSHSNMSAIVKLYNKCR